MISFKSLSSSEIVALTNLLTILLIEDNDNNVEDLNVLGNLLVAVGSIILTVAAQEASVSSSNEVK